MQRIHVATASKHKDKEVEYKSCVDAMKRSDEAYRDLQARSALNKTIVAAFKRSARIEGLIRMVMEDLVQCRRHPDECIMKNMCHAIVGEFDVQTEHFGVEIRAAGPLDKLLTIWVKTRNASAHKEEVIGRVDYERYHSIMDVLETTLGVLHRILTGKDFSPAFGVLCDAVVSTATQAASRPLY
ncbi:hypothetical protein PINS_up009805 [Pythium insidiosum]|nr:hypothetical protein PINS_up009805 [Pythium insidiosum]